MSRRPRLVALPALPPIVRTSLVRETAEAYWYDAELRDGRVIRLSIPKN